jgi:RNA polymerase sigma-70 factor (ECF subfamily)
VVEPCLAADVFLRARAGEQAAFAALVRAHQRMVFSIAQRMLGERALAEDLAQEVFLQAHRSLSSLESTEHLTYWLRRTTTHRAIDQLRQRRVSLVPLEAASEVPAAPTGDDPLLENRIAWLLRQLTPVARAVLLLRYQQDLDPSEIARTLDLPVNTVKSHLQRSIVSLRTQLTAEEPPGRVRDE